MPSLQNSFKLITNLVFTWNLHVMRNSTVSLSKNTCFVVWRWVFPMFSNTKFCSLHLLESSRHSRMRSKNHGTHFSGSWTSGYISILWWRCAFVSEPLNHIHQDTKSVRLIAVCKHTLNVLWVVTDTEPKGICTAKIATFWKWMKKSSVFCIVLEMT